MKSLRLFEFEDLEWFPQPIRDAGTDFLRFMWEVGKTYMPIVPLLKKALLEARTYEIVDLGSGGGGPTVAIYQELLKTGLSVRLTLSDKFPNLQAFRYARQRTNGEIAFVDGPVDARAVPPHLTGFRTMFATLHHFPPDLVRGILQDALRQQSPIGIFDFAPFPSLLPPSWPLLANPLGVLLATPFVRPFRWSRLFWTYVLPIVPLFFLWDVFVSGLRLYSVRKLEEIVNSLPPNDYVWHVGSQRQITYLIGYLNR